MFCDVKTELYLYRNRSDGGVFLNGTAIPSNQPALKKKNHTHTSLKKKKTPKSPSKPICYCVNVINKYGENEHITRQSGSVVCI